MAGAVDGEVLLMIIVYSETVYGVRKCGALQHPSNNDSDDNNNTITIIWGPDTTGCPGRIQTVLRTPHKGAVRSTVQQTRLPAGIHVDSDETATACTVLRTPFGPTPDFVFQVQVATTR